MIDRIPQLESALRANAALRLHAERLVAAYVAPESDRPAISNELIALFGGPAQREAERLTREGSATTGTSTPARDVGRIGG